VVDYSPAIWRGNRFNTAMHWLFSAACVHMTATFAAARGATSPAAADGAISPRRD
jgi:hypothetical protein